MLKHMQLWKLTRRVHVSWIIAVFCGSFVVGVVASQYPAAILFSSGPWVVIACVLLAVSLWKRVVVVLLTVAAAGLLLGIWRGMLPYAQLAVYERLHGKTLAVTGTVSEDPDLGKRNDSLLRLKEIKIDGREVTGSVWVSTHEKKDVRRSDRVTAYGKLSSGFGSFGAAIYRAKIQKIERPEPGDVALGTRDRFAETVRKTIDEPQASLGLGYLLGLRRALPPELDEALVIAGLTHIVVASGYNLTILVRFARRVFMKISKFMSVFAAGTMIIAFIAVTGMSPSMSRAGLVAGLSLAAWYYGRKFHPLVLLPFAAAVTVAINPAYGWNDLGWQLSFTAFAGVMILAPLLQRYFYGTKKPGMIRQILGETVSATILTMPILVLAFGQFSNVSIIANLLVLPLVPLAMLLTFLAGISSLVFPAAIPIVGLPAQWLLAYMTTVADYLARLPWALTVVEIQPWMAAVAYAIITGVCVYLWRATKYDLRNSNIVE